jgi:hypothetical protein
MIKMCLNLAQYLHCFSAWSNKGSFRKKHGFYKDFTACCIAVEWSTSKVIISVFEVTASAHVLGLQDLTVILLLKIVMHLFLFSL